MTEREVMAEVVAQWRDSGPALDAVHRKELAELTEARALRAAEDLLDLLNHLPPKEGGSGLVEQQRLFALLRG